MADHETSPVERWRNLWSPWLSLAPQNLSQPINPGWSFGNIVVSPVNSSAPEVEQAVVARHSYGRQIGRVMDAVSLLLEVTGADKKKADDPRVKDFAELARQVRSIKEQARRSRIDRLRDDLEKLAQEDPEAFAALKQTLKA